MNKEQIKQAFKDYSEYMNDSEVDEDNKKDFNEWIDSLPIQSPAAEVSDEIPDEQIDYLLKDQMGLPHYVKYESLAPTLKATYDYGKRILEMVRSKLQGRKEGWVSVKDKPKVAGDYWVFDPNGFREPQVVMCRYDSYNNSWHFMDDVIHPTHYIALNKPTAPTEGREG